MKTHSIAAIIAGLFSISAAAQVSNVPSRQDLNQEMVNQEPDGQTAFAEPETIVLGSNLGITEPADSAAVANAFLRFAREKKGCVAFLGGSITAMTGWREMTKEELQKRFPQTEFDFIEAGIPSLGSTPHAFRLYNDVLSKATPDLLFVEAAVNDDTNEFTGIEQIRGMEGIVRHCLKANPLMDIVMLQFIYEPFIPLLEKGDMPEVIVNHEKVASHYGIASINCAKEISARMQAGELTWEAFGGTHPLPLGHRYYAAAIGRLFDRCIAGSCEAEVLSGAADDAGAGSEQHAAGLTIKAHPMPAAMDGFCYEYGKFVVIKKARLHGNFRYVQDWEPTVRPANTRPGFVHVPFLETTGGEASLTFRFKGRAVGIFCVAGPGAGVLQYSIDGGEYQEVNTYTRWSRKLYLPWVYMLAQDLSKGHHTLRLKIKSGDRMDCQIRNFVVNE